MFNDRFEQRRDGGINETQSPTVRRRAVLGTLAGAATIGTAGCLGVLGGESSDGPCDTPSTNDVDSLLPDLNEDYSAQQKVNSGLPTGTNNWVAQVITGTDGSQFAFVVGKYESSSAAEDGASSLVDQATTTPAYVVTGNYLFFVDGAGTNESIQELLAMAPPLGSDCVAEQVVFPNSG
jgi:hypothetical protein